MDHFRQTSARTYPTQKQPVPSQQRLELPRPEQHLPSIREFVPPLCGDTLEFHTQEVPSSRPIAMSYLSLQPPTDLTVSAPSVPVQTHHAPMLYTVDNVKHIRLDRLQPSLQLQTPARPLAEYSSPWSAPSIYTDHGPMSASPTVPTQFEMTQPMTPLDTEESVYPSANSIPPQAHQSPDTYQRRRTPEVRSTPRYNVYRVMDSSYQQSTDFDRYGQLHDQYRNLVGYSDGYRSVDTSRYHSKNGHLLSYPMMGSPSHAGVRRRRGNLPKPVIDILRLWLQDHLDHPYPSDEQKQIFMQGTGLTISQISNWFINARRRQLPALKLSRRGRRP